MGKRKRRESEEVNMVSNKRKVVDMSANHIEVSNIDGNIWRKRKDGGEKTSEKNVSEPKKKRMVME